MNRTTNIVAATAVAAIVALAGATTAFAQAHQHDHGTHGADHHHHAGAPVECTTLARPPWTGLPESDRERIRVIEEAVAPFSSPEAAAAAGFRPALGNIPTMGVHWVHSDRTRAGFELEEPDHLMFAPVDGEDRLVGVAYAFRGPLDAEVPAAFDSELAAWHDHPQLGGPGQTLHMLHVWLEPSVYGPFAGNNFLLPYRGAGVHPPDPCWISAQDDVDRFELVAMTLTVYQIGDAADRIGVFGGLAGGLGAERLQARQAALQPHIAALDAAARTGDRETWTTAADALLDALAPMELARVEALRNGVVGVQSSSQMRSGQLRRDRPAIIETLRGRPRPDATPQP